MFRTFTLALSAARVQYPIWLFFCSSVISCFPEMLLRYRLSDYEMVPFAPVTTGITFAFTFHMRWYSVMGSLCFTTFSASFLNTFLSPEIATCINKHVPFLLSWIFVSGLLLGTVLSVRYYYYYHHHHHHFLPLFEAVDLRVPNSKVRVVNWPQVDFKRLKCPSSRCPSVFNTISRGTGISNGRSVLIKNIFIR